MRRIFILLYILFMSMHVYAFQAPKVVTHAFQQKFNGASNVRWEKENETNYEAIFDMNGKRMAAIFNGQGQWLATETEVGLRGLPGISRVVLQTRFIGWSIATAHKIEKADGTSLFRATLNRRGAVKDVFLKKNGTIIR